MINCALRFAKYAATPLLGPHPDWLEREGVVTGQGKASRNKLRNVLLIIDRCRRSTYGLSDDSE